MCFPIKNLVIDFGNTYVKLYLLEKNRCFYHQTQDEINVQEVSNLIKKHADLGYIIVVSVIDIPSSFLKFLKEWHNVFMLSADMRLPFKTLYMPPETLGIDRVALVAASQEKYPQQSVLTIDIGSCITYDFLSKEGVYLGGGISPGLEMRLHSLSHFTKSLPSVKSRIPKNIIGTSTSECMLSGCYFGIISEVEGVIADYKNEYESVIVVLTGGGASKSFVKRLKSSIFAEPYFLAEGGLKLLKFNKH